MSGLLWEDAVKVLLAVLAGGIIGLEREYRDRAAGFRTLIFICVGSTLFTMLSTRLAGNSEPARIASNIVSGVGFLGAGVILRAGGRVVGLTTAATIWLTAALGMAVGAGEYVLGSIAVGVGLIVLWAFPRIEHWIDNVREERACEVVLPLNREKLAQLEGLFGRAGLDVYRHGEAKSASGMTITWQARGSPQGHEQLVRDLMADPDVRAFRY